MENGTLPVTDPFSAYGEGKAWVAYSWLFEVGMYGLFRVLGESGIIFYTMIGVWLIMLMMHRMIATRCEHFLLAGGLLATSMLAIASLYTPRPWLLTILFSLMTLEVVLQLREGKQSRWFWLLPLAYVAWANIHIQFVYGLGLLGLGCAAPLIDRYGQRFTKMQPVMVWGSRQWRILLTLTVACVAASFVNPHHVRLYSVVVELSAQTGMWEYTQEMQAPAFRTAPDWAMLLLFALALVRLGWRRSCSSFEILLLFGAGIFAMRGLRDSWLLVLAALVVLTSQKSDASKTGQQTFSYRGLTAIILFVTIGVVWTIIYRGLSQERIQENTGKIYPVKAAAFVEQQGYPGPLYNHFDWGGHLIWRLPRLKVSIDGRANIYGDQRIKEALGTWAGRPRWSDDPALNHAQVIIAQKEFALTAILRLDSRFRVAYQDDTAVVFIRAASESDQPSALASTELSPRSPKLKLASSQKL